MKLVKRISAGLGILAGLLLIMLLTFIAVSEMYKMKPAPSQPVTTAVTAVLDAPTVNLYLIKTKTGYIAVDAGQNAANVQKSLAKLGLDPATVEAVLLTHTDSDHTAALRLFANAQIYLSRAEEQMINGKTARKFCFHNGPLPRSYQLLDDNQTLVLSGVKVRCIATPGHTPGSISYLVNDQYLFTGDTLALQNGKAIVFNKFFNMDTPRELESIRKLTHLQSVKYILTAHYGINNNPGTALAGWLQK